MPPKKTPIAAGGQRRVTLERTFDAPLRDVWDLWTTKEGIESWWGPDHFAVEVRKLDVRPGGALAYTMRATDPAMFEQLKAMGAPLITEARATYTEVVPRRRLGWSHVVDFVPGVKPYSIAHLLELHEGPNGVRMVLIFDAMHDDEWTRRATMGWDQELGKLARALGA